MTGKREDSRCPSCGGNLMFDLATIPFVLNKDQVVVIKGVPAEICQECHEPFMVGNVTDDIMSLLNQLKLLGSEVSVVSFPERALA